MFSLGVIIKDVFFILRKLIKKILALVFGDFKAFVFYAGHELSFTFRFNDHLGLFISENVLLDFGATAFKIENDGKELYKSDALRTVGITTTPKIGLAITL